MPTPSTYRLKQSIPTDCQHNLLRPHIALNQSTGILTRFPSTTHLCLALGADSPYADERCVGNLGLSVSELFTRFIATHVNIRTSDSSRTLLNAPSQPYRTLLYHMLKAYPRLRLPVLAPLHLPRRTTRLVSYYAFFK